MRRNIIGWCTIATKTKVYAVEGHVVVSTKHSYFNQANMNRVREGIPEGALIVSVNHLGEMTEEEWNGE